jgi:hypothetical protein
MATNPPILEDGDCRIPYDRLNDIDVFVETFAKDTYRHFRQVLDRLAKPPDADLKEVVNTFDKTSGYTSKSKRIKK